MAKQTKFHIVFDRKKTTIKPEDQALIYIDCTKNGKRKYLSTGIRVQKKQFKGANLNWIHKTTEALVLNTVLSNILNKLISFDNEQMLKGIDYPLETLERVIQSKQIANFVEYYQNYYTSNPKLGKNTKKYYKTTLHHLAGFGKIKYFSDINYINISAFDKYLHSQKLKLTTICKYHKALKSVINEAIKSGYLENDLKPYQDIKLNAKAGDSVFLTLEELSKIENLEIENDHWGLSRCKDIFLMCSYTGLRYSDIIQLNDKTVFFNDDKIEICLISKKTKKEFRLTLNDWFKPSQKKDSKPVEIMKKYREFLSMEPFKISDQYYNRQLKQIAKASGINKNLTSHVARHTFGTIMAQKVPSFVLQTLMQHSDIKTTSKYVNLSTKDNLIKNINWD